MVSKGFAYVDFESGADLELALDMAGTLIKNMAMRIDISERKDGMAGGFRRREDHEGPPQRQYEDQEKFQGQWRRAGGPAPPVGRPSMRSSSPSSGGDFGGGGDFKIERRTGPPPQIERPGFAGRTEDVKIERRTGPPPQIERQISRADSDIKIERRTGPPPQIERSHSPSGPRHHDDIKIERRTGPPPPIAQRSRSPDGSRHDADFKIERRTEPLPVIERKRSQDRAPHSDPDFKIERRTTPLEPVARKNPDVQQKDSGASVDLGSFRRQESTPKPPVGAWKKPSEPRSVENVEKKLEKMKVTDKDKPVPNVWRRPAANPVAATDTTGK